VTPAEHIAAAEKLADRAFKMDNDWSEDERIAVAIISLTHACIAIGIELGAPHQSGDTVAASSGQ
jgi:hypothetical protein